ncbi:MAG: aspartate-semialdehyde dehydrogenase [Elusimicrobiota bacterium]
MKKYNVGVVGIGLVGSEMVKVIGKRNFPVDKLRIFATRERMEEIAGQKYSIEVAKNDSFKDIDIVFFAGTEGAKGASRQFGWKAVEQGAFVIDNGDDYRMDPRVPLVVPEVNSHHLSKDKRFIANPNCSTIQMVVALAPLHRAARMKRVVVSTYQSVSGTGRAAVTELERQTAALVSDPDATPEISVYPKRIAFNVFPHIGTGPDGEFPGYYSEEVKMIKETRKIFDAPGMAVSATCVRVPVFFGHSESINVQFEKKISAEEARDILRKSPGVRVMDEPQNNVYPVPLEAAGRDDVYVGRIRQDPSCENALDIWVVADNILKGAALNAVQIGEKLLEMNIL